MSELGMERLAEVRKAMHEWSDEQLSWVVRYSQMGRQERRSNGVRHSARIAKLRGIAAQMELLERGRLGE